MFSLSLSPNVPFVIWFVELHRNAQRACTLNFVLTRFAILTFTQNRLDDLKAEVPSITDKGKMSESAILSKGESCCQFGQFTVFIFFFSPSFINSFPFQLFR